MEEVVPRAASVQGLTRSSILTARRRVRAAPQTGVTYGSAGANGGNQQIQFVIADQGGLLDPASVAIVYNIKTYGAGAEVPDDGHPFTRMQISLNGQMLEDNAQAAKCTNAEVKLATSKAWYQTSGSFCGFELLNNELNTGGATGASATNALTQAYCGAFADVSGNIAAIAARTAAAATTANPLGGEQRSLPLGLISGVGRMKQYLPLSVLGEINLTLYTGSRQEIMFQNTLANNDGDFSLSGVYIEYDIVVGHPEYMNLLARVANDPNEQGLVMPFESTIMTSSGTIATSSSLVENSIVVSRATNHLVRTFLLQQPTANLASTAYPSQSCFGHCQTNKVQWRVGSMYYPQIPAEGDASIWNMTALAYGSASLNEASSVINRVTWAQTTNVVAPSVAAQASNGYEGVQKFNYSDSFIPAYGFQNVKGEADPLAVDGISLSGASGSQLVCVVTNATPGATSLQYTPTLGLVALRFIQAAAGAVRVQGA
jgi:hypothetical protein